MEERSIDSLLLDGGCLCLNFINTIHDRYSDEPFDYLDDYDKILEWSVKVEILTEPEKKEIVFRAEKHETEAEKVHGRILRAREILYDFFLAVAQDKRPGKSAFSQFNGLLSETMSHLQLNLSGQLVSQHHWKDKTDLKYPLYPVIKSAYDLLTADIPERIKECTACGWLFLDQSKNKSRKWCSMESCGSNVKAKRYYHRKKAAER